jgi:hypothetical protein
MKKPPSLAVFSESRLVSLFCSYANLPLFHRLGAGIGKEEKGKVKNGEGHGQGLVACRFAHQKVRR